MKKIISMLMVLVLVLAACGGGSNEVDEDTILVWADAIDEPFIESIQEDFEKDTGIKLKVEYKGAPEQLKEVETAAPAGNGPDIYVTPHDQLGTLVSSGLNVESETSSLEGFEDVGVQAVTYDGKTYGVPRSVETYFLFYLNEVFPDGAPETFEEVLDTDYETPLMIDPTNFYYINSFMSGFGGDVFGDDNTNPNQLGLGSPGAIEGLNYVNDNIYPQLPKGMTAEASYGLSMDAFKEGKSSSLIMGPWAVSELDEAGVDYSMAPLPKLPNGNTPESFVGVKTWQVNSYSEKQDKAWEFINYVSSDESVTKKFETISEVTPKPIISKLDNELAQVVLEQANNGVPMPNIPEIGQVWEPMAGALELVYTDKATPEEALGDAEEQISRAIENA